MKSWKEVEGGGKEGGDLQKANKNEPGERERGSSLYVSSLCEKSAWFFKQKIEFLLISCSAVLICFSVLSLVQHLKVFFHIKKRRRHFFFVSCFFMNMWIFLLTSCIYIYMCVCVCVCVKNIVICCWVIILKNIILFTLITAQIFIQRFISIADLFLTGDGITH